MTKLSLENKLIKVTCIRLTEAHGGSNGGGLLDGARVEGSQFYSTKPRLELTNAASKYTPKPGDKLYFSKGCTVPRIKAREYCGLNRMAITIKKDNADYIVVPKHIEGEYDYYNQLKKISDFNINTNKMTSNLKKIIQDLPKDEKYIAIEFSWGLTYRYSLGGGDTLYKYAENFEDLLGAKNLICEEAIIENINNNKEPLTLDDFKQLKKLYYSNDMGSASLGGEMLSNCNYEESIVFLLPLYQMFRSSLPNTVNCKALIKFCDQFSYARPHDLMGILKDRKKLTKITFENIIKMVKEDVNSRLDVAPFKIGIIPPTGIYENLDEGEIVEPSEFNLVFT
jgi:hypothetical protein